MLFGREFYSAALEKCLPVVCRTLQSYYDWAQSPYCIYLFYGFTIIRERVIASLVPKMVKIGKKYVVTVIFKSLR